MASEEIAMNKKTLFALMCVLVLSLTIGSGCGITSKSEKQNDKTEVSSDIESVSGDDLQNDERSEPAETVSDSERASGESSSDTGETESIKETDSQIIDESIATTTQPIEIKTEYINTETSLYTYEQMMADLEEMSNAFPMLMSVEICGTSLDGRNIPEVILGNPDSGRHIFIQASIHAREYINTLLAMKQIEQLLLHHVDGVYEDVPYDELLSQACIYILPMSNPDGVTISQMGIDGIRDENLKETLRECYQNDLANGRASGDMDSYWKTWKANARGVDLNRNFDAGWETYEGVSYPSSDHYKGTSPVSEPETKVIVDAVHNCNAGITISYHSTGSVIYWDYGSEGEVHEKDAALSNFVQAVTGYPAVSSIQSSQDAAGCSDYFVLKEGVPSVTIENGYSACPIDIEEFPAIWESNEDLLPALIYNGF